MNKVSAEQTIEIIHARIKKMYPDIMKKPRKERKVICEQAFRFYLDENKNPAITHRQSCITHE